MNKIIHFAGRAIFAVAASGDTTVDHHNTQYGFEYLRI